MDKDPITAVCQECHEVIRAPSDRATGMLLAFHIFDSHRTLFIDMYEKYDEVDGDVIKPDMSHNLIQKCCECNNTEFVTEQSKSGIIYKLICAMCGKEHRV